MGLLKWFFWNGLFVAVLVFGVACDNEYAQNAALFWIWFHNVVSLVCLSDSVAQTIQEKRAKTLSMPASINLGFDLAVSIGLASIGWFWSASFYLIAGILQGSAMVRKIEVKGSE